MIRKLIVSNYRSLCQDICFQPGALSFLIDPNGSGKSNILDVLSFVRDAVMQGLPAAITHRRGIDSIRRRSHGRPFDVHIELQIVIRHQQATYQVIITGDRLEEYRVKSETAIMYGRDGREESSFRRNGNDWDGPTGVAPFMDEQSLALTALEPVYDLFQAIYVTMRVLFLNPDEAVMICEYPSNISREQFSRIESILLSVRKRTKPRTVDLYEVFCAILACAEKWLSMEDAASRFPEMEHMLFLFSEME